MKMLTILASFMFGVLFGIFLYGFVLGIEESDSNSELD